MAAAACCTSGLKKSGANLYRSAERMQAVGSIFKDGEPLHSAVNKVGKGRRKSLLGVVLVGTSVYDCACYAGIAQLVEQRIRNAQVMGSSPFTGSTTILYL